MNFPDFEQAKDRIAASAAFIWASRHPGNQLWAEMDGPARVHWLDLLSSTASAMRASLPRTKVEEFGGQEAACCLALLTFYELPGGIPRPTVSPASPVVEVVEAPPPDLPLPQSVEMITPEEESGFQSFPVGAGSTFPEDQAVTAVEVAEHSPKKRKKEKGQ